MSAEVMQKAALRRSHAQYAGKNSIQGSLRESEVRTPEFYLMMGKRGIKSSHKSSDWVIGELGNLSACTQITHLPDLSHYYSSQDNLKEARVHPNESLGENKD